MTTSEGTRVGLRPTNHPTSMLYGGRQWWACEYPERPFHPDEIAYFASCYPCWISAVAAIKHGHGDLVRPDTLYGEASLRDCIIRSGEHFGHFDRAGIEVGSIM